MFAKTFRNTLFASSLLIGASLLAGPAAMAADPAPSGGTVGGNVEHISTLTFANPATPALTALDTGADFAMGNLSIRNNDPQGWDLSVVSTNSGKLQNGDADTPSTMYITYSALTAAGEPALSTNTPLATVGGTSHVLVTAPYNESFASPAGGVVTISATIAGAGVAGSNNDVAFDSLPAGTYTDTLTFTLASNE